MNIQPIVALGAFALAVNASFAADPSDATTPLTRAQVKKSVLDAQAAGTLRFGDEPNYPYIQPQTTGKPFKRKPEETASTDPSTSAPAGKKQ